MTTDKKFFVMSFLLALILTALTRNATSQIISNFDIPLENIDSLKFEKWIPKNKLDYQGLYHFGFSEREYHLTIVFAGDTCFAQLRWGEFINNDWIEYFRTFNNIKILGNKLISKDLYAKFAVLKRDGKKIKGLILFRPQAWQAGKYPPEFGSYDQAIYLFYNGKFPQASYRLLAINELQQLSLQDLKIMRNEIYARYGYKFVLNGEMDKYFKSQKWYIPRNNNVDNFITGLEKINIELIRSFEK
jgi:YARHG domain